MKISGLTFLISSLALFQEASAKVLSLTEDNYSEKTAGRTVFLKFFAPWCGHCKAMAEDFEKLANDWTDHKVGLVAEIDCTTEEGQSLCEKYAIEGFPTLLYGDPLSPEPYEGERSYEDMAAFAKEHISTPVCSVRSIDFCTDEQKTIIQTLQQKTVAELQAMEQDVQTKTEAAQEKYDERLQKLSDEYEQMTDEFNKELEKLKMESNYKWVEQLLSLNQDSTVTADEL